MAKEDARKKGSHGYIDLELVITKEGNQYSSWCPGLDIASCGDTPDEAVKNICEAISCYLDALKEEGLQEKIFREKGIKVVQGDEPAIPNSFITHCRQKVSVN